MDHNDRKMNLKRKSIIWLFGRLSIKGWLLNIWECYFWFLQDHWKLVHVSNLWICNCWARWQGKSLATLRLCMRSGYIWRWHELVGYQWEEKVFWDEQKWSKPPSGTLFPFLENQGQMAKLFCKNRSK